MTMRLILDTHVLLWLLEDSSRLSASARSVIVRASGVYVSTASIWEIAIKWRLGKLAEDPVVVVGQLGAVGIEELPVINHHAVASGRLPLLHRDPFDRLLVAQAMTERMQFLTADARLAAYSELVLVV